MPKPQAAEVKPDELPALAAAVIKQAKFPMLATMDGEQPRLRRRPGARRLHHQQRRPPRLRPHHH